MGVATQSDASWTNFHTEGVRGTPSAGQRADADVARLRRASGMSTAARLIAPAAAALRQIEVRRAPRVDALARCRTPSTRRTRPTSVSSTFDAKVPAYFCIEHFRREGLGLILFAMSRLMVGVELRSLSRPRNGYSADTFLPRDRSA